MNKSTRALDQYLDAMMRGDGTDRGAIDDSLADTCDLMHRRLRPVAPGIDFTLALRAALVGNVTHQPEYRTPLDSTVAVFAPQVKRASFGRKIVEVAAVALLFTAAIYAITRTEPDVNLEQSSWVGGTSGLKSTIESGETTGELDPAVMYDMSRVGGTYEINVTYAQLRAGKSFDAPSVESLKRGERLTLLDVPAMSDPNEPLFLRVSTGNGRVGWVWSEVVALAEEEISTQNALSPSDLATGTRVGEDTTIPTQIPVFQADVQLRIVHPTALREEPGLSGYAIAQLQVGDRVWSKGRQIAVNASIWLSVEFQGMGRTFWVNASAVTNAGAQSSDSNPDAGLQTVTPVSRIAVFTASSVGVTIVPGVMAKGMSVAVIYDVALNSEPDSRSGIIELAPTGTILIVTGESVAGATNATWVPVIDQSTEKSGWVQLPWIQTTNEELGFIFPGQLIVLNEDFDLFADHSSDSQSYDIVSARTQVEVDSTFPVSKDVIWAEIVIPGTERTTGWIRIEGFATKAPFPMATP